MWYNKRLGRSPWAGGAAGKKFCATLPKFSRLFVQNAEVKKNPKKSLFFVFWVLTIVFSSDIL
jgi:hypothetical protein